MSWIGKLGALGLGWAAVFVVGNIVIENRTAGAYSAVERAQIANDWITKPARSSYVRCLKINYMADGHGRLNESQVASGCVEEASGMRAALIRVGYRPRLARGETQKTADSVYAHMRALLPPCPEDKRSAPIS